MRFDFKERFPRVLTGIKLHQIRFQIDIDLCGIAPIFKYTLQRFKKLFAVNRLSFFWWGDANFGACCFGHFGSNPG